MFAEGVQGCSPRGCRRGCKVPVCEGILLTSQRDGAAPSASPRQPADVHAQVGPGMGQDNAPLGLRVARCPVSPRPCGPGRGGPGGKNPRRGNVFRGSRRGHPRVHRLPVIPMEADPVPPSSASSAQASPSSTGFWAEMRRYLSLDALANACADNAAPDAQTYWRAPPRSRKSAQHITSEDHAKATSYTTSVDVTQIPFSCANASACIVEGKVRNLCGASLQSHSLRQCWPWPWRPRRPL